MKKLTAPRLIVGSPNVYADIVHMTGFRAPDPVVVVQTAAARHLVVSRMEEGRARAAHPGLTVWTPETLRLPAARRRRLSSWALALVRQTGVRRVDVPASFPLGTARRLERAGVRLHIVEGAFLPERELKRADEIASLRTAQRACVAAMRAAWVMIRAARVQRSGALRLHGRVLTSEDVRRTINRVLLERDCAGGEPIVACGPDAADPHCIGHGPLRAGQPIVIDIFPQHLPTGYWGDITRTVVKGRPSARLARLYRAVLAAQLHGLSRVRAGVRYAAVHGGVSRVLEQHGFRNRTTGGLAEGFIHGTGHGVGLEIHEAPGLGRGAGVLRAGQVVTVEPGLYYRDIGGLRVEDTVVVTRTGFEFLAPCPKTWIIP
jgi:Xaa-Pro aminopeptidase